MRKSSVPLREHGKEKCLNKMPENCFSKVPEKGIFKYPELGSRWIH